MLALLLSIAVSSVVSHSSMPDPSEQTGLHSPLLSQLSALSPVPLPFLDRLDPVLSGAFPLSNLLSIHWWFDQLVFTWAQDPGHLALEVLCFCVIVYLYHRKPYDPRDQERLSPQEEDDLIRTWKPEPLATAPPALAALRQVPVVQAYNHQQLVIGGKAYLSFASSNFLGVASLQSVKAACRATIEKYGVGSCGPRGFYGSFDIHLEVEARLAEFFHAPACILYSDGIATLASVIPAFSKRGDLIVCDEAVHFGIQQGIRLSRSNVLYYKHNDMEDLERILNQVQEKDLRQPGKLNRRFIITEGISEHCGDLAPLPHIVRLKQRYKYRLILDDSFALGVLGATGRGSLEHWSLDVEQCDLLCASLDHATATVGGFCIGSHQVVDHQRLSGAGYCFPELDTRVLTDAGFLFLSEIEQRLHERAPVLYGCYDTTTQSLVYRPGRLVYKAPPRRWVDFTQAATRPLWDATSTDHGAAPGVQRAQANYFTLRTTPGHDMYLQVGTRLGSTTNLRTASDARRPAQPHKMRAEELAPGFNCTCADEGVDCAHGYSAYRFFTSPACGVSNSDVMSIHDTARDSPVRRLGLRSDDELNAFLELYGYWLGDGSMAYDGATSGAVIFAPKKKRDRSYLLGLIARLSLQRTEWTRGVNVSGCMVVRIRAQRWVRYFDEQYGSKYARGRSPRAFAGTPSSSSSSARTYGRQAERALQLSAAPSPTSTEDDDTVSAASPAKRMRAGDAPAQLGMGRSAEEVIDLVDDDEDVEDDADAKEEDEDADVYPSSTTRSPHSSSPTSLQRPSSSATASAVDEDEEMAVVGEGAVVTEVGGSCEIDVDDCDDAIVHPYDEESDGQSEGDMEDVSRRSLADITEATAERANARAGTVAAHGALVAPNIKSAKWSAHAHTQLTAAMHHQLCVSVSVHACLCPSAHCSPPCLTSLSVPLLRRFWYWVFKRLSKEQVRLVLEGVRQADGVSARSNKQEAAGTALSGLQRICTSSVAFRDQLIRACLHAGYTAHFTVNTRAGIVRGYNAVPTDYRIYSQEEMEQLLRAEPSRVFKPVEARHDNWWVHYSQLTSWLSADDVRYDGKALQLRETRRQLQGFVAEHSDGRVVRAAGQGKLGALIGLTQTSVSRFLRQGFERTRAGWVVYTRVGHERRSRETAVASADRSEGEGGDDGTGEDDGQAQAGSLPGGARPASASVTADVADAYSPRDGRTWCVEVEHDDHLIFVQRAHRNAAGVVTKAGLPIITGNCFSASSPPYTATAAIVAVDHISQHPELPKALRDRAAATRRLLAAVPGLQVTGKAERDSVSPVIHLTLKESSGSREQDEALMLRLANKLYADDAVVVNVPEYIQGERELPPVSMLVAVTVEHEDKDVDKLLKALKRAATEVLGKSAR